MSGSARSKWTFLTNHAHVLALLSRNPPLRLRDIAMHAGITERATQRIISHLEACGVIYREVLGGNKQYRIRFDLPLHDPIEPHRTVGELLELLRVSAPRF